MSAQGDTIGRGTRGYMEIVYSILSVCLNGALKTHIMFRCNLNSKQLHSYLESLLDRGFLEKIRIPPSAKVEYRTTPLGRRYMETYNQLLQMLSQYQRVEPPTYVEST